MLHPLSLSSGTRDLQSLTLMGLASGLFSVGCKQREIRTIQLRNNKLKLNTLNIILGIFPNNTRTNN
jgi:hypothetical protein